MGTEGIAIDHKESNGESALLPRRETVGAMKLLT